MQTIKGITRSYRKSLRSIGRRDFPLAGTFHVRDENGNVVKPQDVTNPNAVYYKTGPAPLTSWKPKTQPAVQSAPNLPALNVEQVYKRIVREPKTEGDKRRIDYRPIRNPKAGETVYVKREINGKQKWTEMNYSDLLNNETANVA